MKNRHSLVTQAGRLYQKISPVFSFLDYILGLPVIVRGANEVPAIILLAPPRSGSTLTYQLISESFDSHRLTNVWNLLFATPRFGGLLSKQMCGCRPKGFQSNKGFVPGLCGEAEGLQFWKYWSGISIDIKETDFNEKKAGRLKNILQKLVSDDEVFVAGYLGHVLAVKEMEKLFPSALFVYLKRDLLSNAYSLYQASPDKWFSVRTETYYSDEQHDRYQEVAGQLLDIHQLVLENKPERCIEITYENLCKEPPQELKRLSYLADKVGVSLPVPELQGIPDSFQYRKVDDSFDIHSKALQKALKNELKLRISEGHEILNSLLA